MENTDFYSNAHLIVSAIRILEHQTSTSPSIEDVCRILSFSLEHGHFLFKKLQGLDIIDIVEGAYGSRLFVKNHLKIEEIPRGTQESKLEEELKKFQNSKKHLNKKIESIQAKQAKKQTRPVVPSHPTPRVRHDGLIGPNCPPSQLPQAEYDTDEARQRADSGAPVDQATP